MGTSRRASSTYNHDVALLVETIASNLNLNTYLSHSSVYIGIQCECLLTWFVIAAVADFEPCVTLV